MKGKIWRFVSMVAAVAILVATMQSFTGNVGVYASSRREILANSSVVMLKDGELRTEDFSMEETSVDVRIKLESSVPSARLFIRAYASTTSFDPYDNGNSIGLGSISSVSDGFEGKVSLDMSPLRGKKGYRIIAQLYILVDAEELDYQSVMSQSLNILDENGETFEPYVYPNVSIDETVLYEDTDKLHITLTGDDRIFKAAQEGLTDIRVAVAQYPADEYFDFEGASQIGVCSTIVVKNSFAGQEMKIETPLKAGYRVRAVVFWSQNTDILLAKGNDYEEMFNLPDDSVPVEKSEKEEKAAVLLGNMSEGDTKVKMTVEGSVPEGAMVILKYYEGSETNFSSSTGEPVFLKFGVTAGEYELDLSENTYGLEIPEVLIEGRKLVAYLLKSGEAVATSKPLVIGKRVDVSKEEDSIEIVTAPVTANTTSIRLSITGYTDYKGYYINVRMGTVSTNNNADSRTYVASTKYTGAGVYDLDTSKCKLIAGQTLQANLYRYDADRDRTYYAYSEPVMIEITDDYEYSKASATIVTDSVREDSETVWAKLEFDEMLTARVVLYKFTTEEFDIEKAEIIYSGDAEHSQYSQRLCFGSGRIAAGDKLIAMLVPSVGDKVFSNVKTVAPLPQKTKPTAWITTTDITAGKTSINASLVFDSLCKSATYKVYSYKGETLDEENATLLVSNTLTSSRYNMPIYIGKNRLVAGERLQIVLIADEDTSYSNSIMVYPGIDYGTPVCRFGALAVGKDATEIPVVIDYSDKYPESFGDDFYCVVSVYMVPGYYSDEQIEENELWENFNIATHVTGTSARVVKDPRGEYKLTLQQNVTLKAGYKLFIKLRLPHTEWEGEEEDFLSSSIPIGPEAYLYNLGDKTERGAKLCEILRGYGVAIREISDSELNEKVGFILGEEDFKKTEDEYTGEGLTEELFLMNNFSDELMDEIFKALKNAGIDIGNKAVVTETNKTYTMKELVLAIANEHLVMTYWSKLDSLCDKAEQLEESVYGSKDGWEELKGLTKAARILLLEEEPEAADMIETYDMLLAAYNRVTYVHPEPQKSPEAANPIQVPVVLPTPEVNEGPDKYEAAENTEKPEVTGMPETSEVPEIVEVPETVETPQGTGENNVSEKPVITVGNVSSEIVKLSWNKVENAKQYKVYVKNEKGKYEMLTKVKTTECEISELLAGNTYDFKLVAIIKDNESVIKKTIGTCTVVAKPAKISRVKGVMEEDTLKVSWKAQEEADGYIVSYRIKDTESWNKIRVTDKAECEIQGLEKSFKYEIKVRSYVIKEENSKTARVYGKYSKIILCD